VDRFVAILLAIAVGFASLAGPRVAAVERAPASIRACCESSTTVLPGCDGEGPCCCTGAAICRCGMLESQPNPRPERTTTVASTGSFELRWYHLPEQRLAIAVPAAHSGRTTEARGLAPALGDATSIRLRGGVFLT
jgi:hypothetical protein